MYQSELLLVFFVGLFQHYHAIFSIFSLFYVLYCLYLFFSQFALQVGEKEQQQERWFGLRETEFVAEAEVRYSFVSEAEVRHQLNVSGLKDGEIRDH